MADDSDELIRFINSYKPGSSSEMADRPTVERCDEGVVQAEAACDALDDLCDELPINSHGDWLTRDQLHERAIEGSKH